MSEAKAGERFEMLGGNIQGEFVEVRTMNKRMCQFSTEQVVEIVRFAGEALLEDRDEVAVAELEAGVALLDGGDRHRAEP